MSHRFILEPYKGMSTRYVCPACNRREKTFVRYIDIETGQHLAPHIGRCNREIKCGYHYTPKQYFELNKGLTDKEALCFLKPSAKLFVKPIPPQVSYIDKKLFQKSLQAYEANNFVKYLCGLFGAGITTRLVERYLIGTSKHWPGASIFWQIDRSQQIHSGKIMLYNPCNGKRVKKPFNHITWVHKTLNLLAPTGAGFNLQQCLFGEHLLRLENKPVAIVESEKTAIIASVYFPQHTWLACGSLNNLNAARCQILKGKKATLFPDINGFEKWNAKAGELKHITPFLVSDLLERNALTEEREKGWDLADYLVRWDWKEFTGHVHIEM
jgi:hypothetical protein